MKVRCALAVAVVTAIAYLPGAGGAFLAWDDWTNFTLNPNFQGLSPGHLRWMVTTFHMGHYQPLTWLTLGLDYALYGLNPIGYHVTGLLLHAASAALLFLVLERLFSSVPAAAAGALFWSLHPLRVESVTWITERRDVLCGVFFLLSVLAYLRMCREREQGGTGFRWLGLSVAAYAASLLSKSLGLLLPAALLVLDAVPLRRFVPGKRREVLLEKLPYVACGGGILAVTLLAMKQLGQVRASSDLLERAAQASFGACFYLYKTLLPWNLSPLYPYEQGVNPADAKFVVALVIAPLLTAALAALARKRPGPLAAWVAFLVLAAPVLGAVVRGPQLAADRYTYLSLMPLSLLVAAGLRGPFAGPGRRLWLGGAAAVLLLLGGLAAMQTRVWHDDLALWNQAIGAGWGGAVAFTNRGAEKIRRGDSPGALADFDEALRRNPKYMLAWLNRGKVFEMAKERTRALEDYGRALECELRTPEPYERRATVRESTGDLPGAIADCTEAVRRFPAVAGPWVQRGRLKIRTNDLAGAIADFDEGLKRNPQDARATQDRGKCRFAQGDHDGAWRDFTAAASLDPRLPGVHQDRGSLLGLRGKFADAVNEFSEELRIDPGAAEAWRSRGVALMKMGMRPQAASDFEQALRIAPPAWEGRREVERLLSGLR